MGGKKSLHRFLQYVFTQHLSHKQDVTQGQFLSGVRWVCIQSFPSLKMVTKPRLKNTVWHTICP